MEPRSSSLGDDRIVDVSEIASLDDLQRLSPALEAKLKTDVATRYEVLELSLAMRAALADFQDSVRRAFEQAKKNDQDLADAIAAKRDAWDGS